MTAAFVRENDTVAGKYLIGKTLGEGGMGVVVEARHLELDQLVAIKFLRPEIAAEGASAERFRREARAAVKIRSEHVCRVLDVGTLDTGILYLVMEHLEGCDLSSEVEQRSRLPVEEAVDYVLQACEALAEAHSAGIVHRDLKPGNLFLNLRRDGTRGIKVLDFGVSKSILEGTGQLRLTKTASLVGSPLYMSPEQLDAAKDVDPRADIWALGTILYELVTGRTPFYAETIPQLVNAVMNSSPPSFEATGVSVPPGFETAVMKALAKSRDERYDSVSSFARAIAAFGPPHGMISVLRTERVMSSSADAPSKLLGSSPVASGQTPTNLRNREDTVQTRTLDVNTTHSRGDETTRGTWGGTAEAEPPANRRALVAILALLGAGALAVAIGVSRNAAAPAPAKAALEAQDPAAAAALTPPPVATATPVPTAAPPPTFVPDETGETAAPPAPSTASAKAASSGTPPKRPSPGKTATKPASGASSVGATPKSVSGEGISEFGGRR